MDLVARDLRARLDMMVFSVNWYALPLTDPQGEDLSCLFSAQEQRFGVHAGDLETSMMLAIDPQHVTMAAASHFPSSAQIRASSFDILGNGKTAKFAWQMQDYNPHGAAGNALAATAEKGQALLDAAGRALAQLLGEIDRLPPETLSDSVG
jgi:creatinine amidohydrolase